MKLRRTINISNKEVDDEKERIANLKNRESTIQSPLRISYYHIQTNFEKQKHFFI